MMKSRMDESEREACYRALASRDRRFDGVFFIGVRSTGIYCRPVCRARLAQARNCTFHSSAAAAEAAGYRPCLRCRPELAPGRSPVDAQGRLAQAAYARIESGGLNDRSVAALARELSVCERHLRRTVGSEFGVSPVQLAQTQRLLAAKQLLTETDLPVSRIAFASGFSSISRFNALFRDRYRLSPSALRRTAGSRSTGLRLLFHYRPPLAWHELLRFLAARAIPGVEHVEGGRYSRTLRIGEHAGWFVATPLPEKCAVEVEVSESLVPALMPLRARVRRLFDLDAEPQRVAEHFARDARLGRLVDRRPGLRLPGAVDGFELAVRAVLGQQVSVSAATTLAGRLSEAFGERIAGVPHLTRLPIPAGALAAADIDAVRGVGIPAKRAHTLIALARAVVAGDIHFEPSADVATSTSALMRIPGIGAWTAEYVAMRALHWPDAFPASDLGLRRALGCDDTAALAESWRPWRGYAAMHLWTSLGDEVLAA